MATASDAGGEWLIEGLDPNRTYDVYGRLAGENDVVASDVTPFSPLELSVVPVFPVFNGEYPTATLVARGGEPPYTYSVATGTLPTGVSLVDNELVVTAPNGALGDTVVTLEVEDARADTAQQNCTIRLTAHPLRTLSTIEQNYVFVNGASVTESASATGGVLPYTYAVSAGALPTGLSLNASTGAITGTTSTDGAYSFTITVTDAAAATHSVARDTKVKSPHLYWRMNATAANAHCSVSEMEMSTELGGANLCTGGTPIASGNYPAGSGYTYVAANAFNGAFPGPTDSWASAVAGSGWLGYQFASAVVVGEFRIAARASGSQSPNTFTLQHSDDGLSWTTDTTYTGITAWTYSSFVAFPT